MRQIILMYLFPAILMLSGHAPSSQSVYDLRCENLTEPLSVDNIAPRLSWKTQFAANNNKQTAYQILVATDSVLLQEGKADVWDSGKVPSQASVMVKYAGKQLAQGTFAYWKVRAWDTKDKASAWSRTACFGVELAEEGWQQADYIGMSPDRGNPQSPLLRKQFTLDGTEGRTLLYVNSLGYHEIYLNGQKVGDQVLTPAVSQFGKRSLYNTYDVSALLKQGGNDLIVWLGQGWYRPGHPGVVHEGPLLKVRMETLHGGNRRTVLVSNDSWQASESGYSSIGTWTYIKFGGERVDASRMPDDMTTASLNRLQWHPAIAVNVPPHAVSPQMTESNLITERIHPASVRQLSDSVWLVDMGKALTGWAEIRFPALKKGQEIILTYSDHLDKDGALAAQSQEDRYIASGKANETFRSKFNYHGYQYLKISGLHASPTPDNITGQLIHTGYRQASSFRCSDDDMNAIHDMIQYTFRCLSIGGDLVDCPHLERLGYGGDGNASTETAQTMFDLAPLYANWMQAWADCIQDDGGMPHTAPCPHPAGGGPYWCGFIITASWRTYVNYGDPRLIEKYYPAMQQWLKYVDKYTANGLLQTWPETNYRAAWFLGDWACPAGVDQADKASVDVVVNCFINVCYETMEKIARTLGKDADARLYAGKKEDLRKIIQQQFYSEEKNTYGTGSQIDMAYPLLVQATPAHLIPKVTENLFRETEQNRKGHIACGLVGLPVITEWAVNSNQPGFIYSMLKKRDYPGYLYMIDNGATATWEHWNGDRSRIHNTYNAIGSWFYQGIGGIRPDENEPGYRKVWINPQIPEGVHWAKTTKNTPYGTLAVDWTLRDNTLEYDLTIPAGITAHVALPENTGKYTLNGKTVKTKGNKTVTVGSGNYKLAFLIAK
jgi:alpha-L-rhamnosidase